MAVVARDAVTLNGDFELIREGSAVSKTHENENELFSSYIERVELFFEAINISTANNKEVAVLLSLAGSRIYLLLRSLVAPAKPNEISYKDLIGAWTFSRSKTLLINA